MFSTLQIEKTEILASQLNWLLRGILFFNVFLVAYAYGLDGQTRNVYQNYASALYNKQAEFGTINVVRSVIGCGAYFFFARLSDTFGRLELFIVSILFYVVGTIISCKAYDIGRFAGGSVIYQIGYTGVIMALQLIVADNSYLNWRLLCSFIPALPFVINTWVSNSITSAVGRNWSWGIGMWAFIFPLACVPLLCTLLYQRYLAGKTERWADYKRRLILEEKQPLKDKLIEIFWDTDIVGIILLVALLELILVPLTLTGSYQAAGSSMASAWRKAKIIVPIVLGGVLIPFFVWWEKEFARHPLIPFSLLKDRGVYCAVIVGVFVDLVWYLPNDYLYTILIVAVNESISLATRITSLYSFVSVVTGTIFGFAVVYLRRLKKFIIFGASIWFVSNGLLVYYKGLDSAHSGIIGALCLYGFGAGFFTYPTQASIQSCTSHENMASVTALYLASYNVGAAIGASVSAAVWTNTLYSQLVKSFGNATLAASTYGDPYTFAINYTWGTTERMQAVEAYSHVQRLLSIIGVCLCVPLLIATFGLRDHRLESVQSLEQKKVEEDSEDSEEKRATV